MKNSKAKIYTVSDVNTLIKAALENHLPGRLAVMGEITGWKEHQSGHCYFSLKDEGGQLPCVMWKSDFAKVKFEPENGLAVVASGFIDVYIPQGKYQFYADSMQPAGVGALQLAFEQLVRKLDAEGLFDEKYKKPLPVYPMRIGIITSESGAAVHDITDGIQSRWPVARLFLYPVSVQGEGAAEQIAAAIKDVNKRNRQLKLDVLIVGRGGGSKEDLWAFNEEVVARAIFASKIPLISAVGHETDVTISDFVADAKATTPTKAAFIAVPDEDEVLEQISVMQERLEGNLSRKIELAGQQMETILASAVFKNPLSIVNTARQLVDEAVESLAGCFKRRILELRERLSRYQQQVSRIEPHRILGEKTVQLGRLENAAGAAMGRILGRIELEVTARENRLAALNPKAVLKRGYSITSNGRTGEILAGVEGVAVGDLIITELAEENLIESTVTAKQNKKKESTGQTNG